MTLNPTPPRVSRLPAQPTPPPSEPTSIDQLLGIIFLAILVLFIWLLYKIFTLAWPTIIWLIICILTWGISRLFQHPVAKAMTKTVFPVMVALGVVTFTQIYLNLREIDQYELHAYEALILEFSDNIQSWTDVSVLTFCTIAVVLFMLHLSAPKIIQVKYFIRAFNFISILGAVILIISSFSFFIHEVANRTIAITKEKLIAQIAIRRVENWEDSMRMLATTAVTELLKQTDKDTWIVLEKTSEHLDSVSNLSLMYSEFKHGTYQSNGQLRFALYKTLISTMQESAGEPWIFISETITEPKASTGAELIQHMNSEVRQAESIRLAEAEARATFDAVLSKITEGLTKSATQLVRSIADDIVDDYSRILLDSIQTIAAETANIYFDKLRSPLFDKLLEHGMRYFASIRARPPKEIVQLVVIKTRTHHLNLVHELVTEAKKEGSRAKLLLARDALAVASALSLASLPDLTFKSSDITKAHAEIQDAQEPVKQIEQRNLEFRMKQKEMAMQYKSRPRARVR